MKVVRGAAAELEELRLSLRPAQPAHAGVGREPGEQRSLHLLDIAIQLGFHEARIAPGDARSIGGNTYLATGFPTCPRSA